MDETLVIQESARALKKVIDRVFSKKPKGYSVIFTEYRNPNKEPEKYFGQISEAFKDVLNGTYSNGIGTDIIFETPEEVMSILKENISKELPKMKIQKFDLSILEVNTFYSWPVIVTKK